MTCNKCGAQNPDASSFCTHCGNRLGWVCSCNFVNPSHAVYCGRCGRTVPQTIKPQDLVAAEAAAPPTPNLAKNENNAGKKLNDLIDDRSGGHDGVSKTPKNQLEELEKFNQASTEKSQVQPTAEPTATFKPQIHHSEIEEDSVTSHLKPIVRQLNDQEIEKLVGEGNSLKLVEKEELNQDDINRFFEG